MSEEEENIVLKKIELPHKTVYVQDKTNFVYMREKNGNFVRIGRARGYIVLHGEIVGIVLCEFCFKVIKYFYLSKVYW